MSTLSKEEMENNMHDAIWDSIYAEGGEVGGGNKAVEKCVEICLSFAEQEAIGFNEWVEEKQFMRWRGRWYEKTNDGKSWGDFPNFSKEELYQLYLKSKIPN